MARTFLVRPLAPLDAYYESCPFDLKRFVVLAGGGPSDAISETASDCVLPLKPSKDVSVWQYIKLLTLPSGDYSVIVVPRVGTGELGQFQRIEKVTLKSPTASVFVGGLTGAFIMALFFPVYAYLGEKRSVPATLEAIKKSSLPYVIRLPLRVLLFTWELSLRTVLGGLVAVMLIVVTRTTTDLHLPIAIKVEDFSGGMIAGLLSLVFSKWLAQSLAPKATEPSH